MAEIDQFFRHMTANGGSDLHLAAGLEPRFRRHGSLESIMGYPPLSDESLRLMMEEIAKPDQWAAYAKSGDLDFAYSLPGVGRFRANFFMQQNGAGAIFRRIPEEIIPIDKLNVPPAIEGLAHLDKGLVLVTGPTGSGKSTTLAAVVDKINSTYAKHIVTVEDPVEFVHPNKKSTISQREVGADTLSFAAALRAAIREDANVVLVGEMRDPETIALAITAAEMGLLVFGTLHTNNAAKTIDRIIDAFPEEQQTQVRTMLSESLAAVVSQLLLKTSDGRGRVAVHEILLRTGGLPNVIREGNTPMIHSIIQQGRKDGMQAMDDALFALAKEGRINPEEAFHKSTNKKRFEELLKSSGSTATPTLVGAHGGPAAATAPATPGAGTPRPPLASRPTAMGQAIARPQPGARPQPAGAVNAPAVNVPGPGRAVSAELAEDDGTELQLETHRH